MVLPSGVATGSSGRQLNGFVKFATQGFKYLRLQYPRCATNCGQFPVKRLIYSSVLERKQCEYFNSMTLARLQAYVYALADPRAKGPLKDRIFYVGKGNGSRCFNHAAAV